MNTFIFDLDGTLLPMDQDAFLETYFNALAMKMIPYGLEPRGLIGAVWEGTKSMIENDGAMTNEQRFWDTFKGAKGEEMRRLEPVFDDFYRYEFNTAKCATKTDPIAAQIIKSLKKLGYKVVLATNPLFPRIATQNRIQWAGLDPEDFELITTYENSSFSKPNLEYYKAILKEIGKRPEDCIMVGNDITEDLCVSEIGIDTYLLKDCLINRSNTDITGYKQGYFKDLFAFIQSLPDLAQGK